MYDDFKCITDYSIDKGTLNKNVSQQHQYQNDKYTVSFGCIVLDVFHALSKAAENILIVAFADEFVFLSSIHCVHLFQIKV